MKSFLMFMILTLSFAASAQTKGPRIKSWKTFRSDYGFKFGYPDCWIIYGNSQDEPEVATPAMNGRFINI